MYPTILLGAHWSAIGRLFPLSLVTVPEGIAKSAQRGFLVVYEVVNKCEGIL